MDNSDLIVGRKTKYSTLSPVWHILGADGTPRCAAYFISAFKSSGWEIKSFFDLPDNQLEFLCPRCAKSKTWISIPAINHLRKTLNRYAAGGLLTGQGVRVISRSGNTGRDWTTLPPTESQMDMLDSIGAVGTEMTKWTRGQAADAISWFEARKLELSIGLRQARFYAQDEEDTAYIVFESGQYKVYTRTDIEVVYEKQLKDYDVIEEFTPVNITESFDR